MADATISQRVDLNIPGIEVVRLTASNGETYKTKKFKRIEAVQATLNLSSYTDETVNARWSGQTITLDIKGTDTTDVPVTLTIYGTY